MCPCCIDLYDKQRGRATLPCLHPVCVDCATKNDQGECFYQREFIHCGHKYTKGEVLLLQQGGGAGTKAELCGVCEENATHKCQTCNELFCSADAARHPVARASKGHTVDPLPHVAAAVQNACETHKAMAATIYCVKCDKMACLDCLAAHPSHPVETVVKGLATRAQLIKSKMAAVQKKCDDLKLGGDNEAKQDLDFVTAHLGTTTAKIDEAFDSVTHPLQQTLDEIRARKHELRKQAQDAIGADVKTLEQQVDMLATFKHDVDFVKATVASSSSSSTQALVAARLSALDKVVINPTPAVKETSYFVYSQSAEVAKLLEAIKAVQVAQLGGIAKSALRAPPKPVVIGRDYKTIGAPLRSFGKYGSGQGELIGPTGLSVDRDGNLMVGDKSNRRLQVFTKDGVHVRFINCAVSNIFGVSVAPSGDVWVGDCYTTYLVNSQNGAKVRTITCPSSLYCASLPDGSVLVTTNNANKVHLFNAAGV